MKKKSSIFAFIDSQNLNLGVQSQGWKLDWRKFRHYLKQKYGVVKAYLFIGYLQKNEDLYNFLGKCGYILIFKPTLSHHSNRKEIIKGNVDAELVLHTMIQYRNYSKAVIVSGDGDFHCLIEYLETNKKLLKVLVPTKHYSSLLRKFEKNQFIARIDALKTALERA